MNKTIIEDTKVFLDRSNIDNDTYQLVEKMNKSPALNHIRVMPDCHSSSYCCVGMTSLIDDKVIPQIVGGDIGCGIIAYNLNKTIKDKQYKKIDDYIKKNIPMGENSHKKPVIEESYMEKIYDKCNIKFEFLKEKIKTMECFQDIPSNVTEWYQSFKFNKNYYSKLVSKLNVKTGSTNFLRSMGTLGGGNHYIEFNEEQNGNCYVTIHSGSRYMGQAICNFHQNKITINQNYDKKRFLNNYLEKEDTIEYLIDMIFAQEFASHNRLVMLQIILSGLGIEYNEEKVIETIHNYIDFQRLILRKGAISAEKGENCIISLNMKDGILLCRGKGNKDWNYSSAHGCGRIMSRKDATKCFTLKEYKKCMEEVYSSCINKDTLDEIPLAYKDVNLIKDAIGDSVEIVKQLKPIINIKGY